MAGIIKETALKELFKKKGFRINKKVLKKFSEIIQESAEFSVQKITRNARISGRKTIRLEDFEVLSQDL